MFLVAEREKCNAISKRYRVGQTETEQEMVRSSIRGSGIGDEALDRRRNGEF